MSVHDLIKSVEDFLSATSNQCYQPGEKADVARSNLLNQLKLEKSNQFNLMSTLTEMLSNPPGDEGIEINGHIYANSYIDAGYQEAIKNLLNKVNS